MKKYITVMFLVAISAKTFAGDSTNVNIIRSIEGKTQAKYVIPFSSSEAEFDKNVWRSPGGIECSVSLVPQTKGPPKGTFDCRTPENYQAEIDFDCSKNNSKDTSAYMFFGQRGDPNSADSIGNFYVWCE